VGLDRIELSTSPLSGVRSSHQSYRPLESRTTLKNAVRSQILHRPGFPGCVGLLLRARAASTWWSWSGSNRRPPECKSGALPAELQPLRLGSGPRLPPPPPTLRRINRGQLDAGTTGPAHGHLRKTRGYLSGDPERAHRPGRSPNGGLEWNDCFLLRIPGYTPREFFRKLHPRSLLERR
jgi:hypothetical protein